jgi:hypothetical protein
VSARLRWAVLLGALAVTAWLAIGGRQTPTMQIVDVAEPTRARPEAPRAEPEILALAPRKAEVGGKALFAATSWTPPPPKPPPPPPPAPPMAPPLPFKYVGKQRIAGGWEVFINRGEQVLVVRAGQSIDAAYRVESVKPPTMVLTYLPLDETQSMSIGEDE